MMLRRLSSCSIVVLLGILSIQTAPDAAALDQDSLRVRRLASTSVELSWTDPDPTVYCIRRDTVAPAASLLSQSATTSFIDGAAGGSLLFYSVDEPASGFCTPPPPPSCSVAGSLACGVTLSSRNDAAGSADLVDSWSGCAAAGVTGPEIAYSFVATDAGLTAVALTTSIAELDLIILEDRGAGCDPANCVATGDSAANFTAIAGATYYILVDGRAGAVGAFDVVVTCPTTSTSCASIGSIACGTTVVGDVAWAGGSDVLVDYAGCSAAGLSGREVLHELVPTSDDTLTVALSAANSALEVLVLHDDGADCEAATCVAVGDNLAQFPAVAGERYWIVVDSATEVTGAYQLDVACTAAQCEPDATLLCGNAFAHNTTWPVFTDVNDTYPCTVEDESGPEYTFSFTATQSGSASATLSSLTADLDVLILESPVGCSAQSCIAWGDLSVDFGIVGGRSYEVVVDGRGGQEGFFRLDLSCVVPPSGCDPHGAIGCGDLVGNDSAAGRDAVDSWPCAPGLDYSGPEYVFQYVPTESATVRVVMDLNIEDLGIIVVQDAGSGCQPSNCSASGDQEVTFDAVGGGVYYIIVDGRAGASDIFRLWMDCRRVPGTCRPTQPIACGETITSRNDATGSTDSIDQYDACLPYPEDGPEIAYEFNAAVTGILRATVTNVGADLDIVVLRDQGRGCEAAGCAAIGNQTVDVAVTAGERYYVLVEGYTGNIGGFDLRVDCL